MNPVIRIAVVIAALSGVFLIARTAWPAVASNLTALKSWNRTEGEVRAMNGDIELKSVANRTRSRVCRGGPYVGLASVPESSAVIDPVDPLASSLPGSSKCGSRRRKCLTLFCCCWPQPGWARASAPVRGRRRETQPGWMFTESPGPLSGAIILHSPTRQWKIVLAWSLLGVAMAVIPMLDKEAIRFRALAI